MIITSDEFISTNLLIQGFYSENYEWIYGGHGIYKTNITI